MRNQNHEEEQSLAGSKTSASLTKGMSLVLKAGAYYSIGDFLLKAAAIVTLPIYTRIFNLEDFGVLSFVLAVQGLMVVVLALGLDNAYARYFFEKEEIEFRRGITSTVLLSVAVIGVAISIPAVWYSEQLAMVLLGSPKDRLAVAFAVGAIPFMMVNSICAQALRNEVRPKLFLLQSIATTIMTVGLSLVAVLVGGMGIEGVLAGMLVGTSLMTAIRICSISHLVGNAFSLRTFRLFVRYGWPLMVAGLAYWVLTLSDRLMIGRLDSMAQLSLYSVAMAVSSVLFIILGGFGQAFLPHLFQIHMESPSEVPAFLGRTLAYLIVGFGGLCVGVTVFAPEILMVLVAEPFQAARSAVGPLALGVFAYATTQVTAAGISITKRTQYVAYVSWSVAVLNVILNVILIPRYGMIGAAVSSMLSFTVLSIVYSIISQRIYPVVYEIRKTMIGIVLTFLFTFGANMMPGIESIVGILFKIAYLGSFFLCLYVFAVISRQDMVTLRRMLPNRGWLSSA